MFAGEHLNVTEDRAVLHPALRAPRDEVNCELCKRAQRHCLSMSTLGSIALLAAHMQQTTRHLSVLR